MKIQLDFDNKVVKVEDNVNLHEFIKTVKKLLSEWKEWDIATNSKIEWVPYYLPYWNNEPYVYYTTDTEPIFTSTPLNLGELTSGVINVEIK